MLDVLLRFDSEAQAAQIGMALGYTTQDPDTKAFSVTQATMDLAACVIGAHWKPDGTTTAAPDGTQVPNYVSDNKWWVMVRSMKDLEIPKEIQPFIVTPDPNNPAIPNQRWA